MSNEIDHSMDGIDPDAPRYGPRGYASRLVDDLADLRAMSESDLKHYAGTPRGTPQNTNRKR